MKRNWASELRAIADGRLLLNVRNGVTVSRSMLASIADELEALSSHPRATSTVDDHGMANMSDKPEGQQEPIPRNVVWFGFDENTGEFTGEYCSVKPADARGMRPYIPYTARPPEQAVTEAMVEAALGEWFKSEVTWSAGMAPATKDQMFGDMRAALKAAMEAGDER